MRERRPAILSYRLWEQWFERRPDAIGQTVWIDNQPHTVIGVMPRRFWFSELGDPIWTLLDPGTLTADTDLLVIVRRPDGTSTDTFATTLQGPLAAYSRQLASGEGPLKMRLSAIKGTPIAEQMSALLPYVLGTAVLLTLIIACANVAILMIAQWTRREAETAMRSALGASRWRLIRAMVAESVLLASCAGLLGIMATYALRGIMLRNAPVASNVLRPVHSSGRADQIRCGDTRRWHPRRHRPGAVRNAPPAARSASRHRQLRPCTTAVEPCAGRAGNHVHPGPARRDLVDDRRLSALAGREPRVRRCTAHGGAGGERLWDFGGAARGTRIARCQAWRPFLLQRRCR